MEAAPHNRFDRSHVVAQQPLLRMVYQPILALATGDVAGYEALARFPDTDQGPLETFAAAWEAGQGPALEARALRTALNTLRPVDRYLSVNISPGALEHEQVWRAFPRDLSGIVVEITEQDAESAQDLDAHVARLRRRGAIIAVDDTGAGFAGLTRLMDLRPEVIKLDRLLVSGLDHDDAKLSLVEALVRYARRVGSNIVAEGVETLAELEVLADLDVTFGQGYALGRPAAPWADPTPSAVTLCRTTAQQALQGNGTGRSPGSDGLLEGLSAWLADVPDLDQLATSTTLIAELLHAHEVLLSVFDPETDSVRGVERHAWSLESRAYALADYPLTARVLADRVAAQVLAGDPTADPAEQTLLRELGHGSALLVPVVARGQTIGLLEAYSQTPRMWTRIEITRARTIAHILGLAIRALQIS
jgi:EAL domain-containing protein (putative c-di-GMP-specific phosphodiesterase class I)